MTQLYSFNTAVPTAVWPAADKSSWQTDDNRLYSYTPSHAEPEDRQSPSEGADQTHRG